METPAFFQPAQFTPEKRHADAKPPSADHFIIEDLLDFPTDDSPGVADAADVLPGTSTESSTVTAVDSCNSSFSGGDPPFSGDIACRSGFPDAPLSGDLCVPYDDLAELEWLSNFVEESFSSEDLQKLQIISGAKIGPSPEPETRQFQPEPNRNSPVFSHEVSVPGKARSKRSRAAPCDWTSRLLALSPAAPPPLPEPDMVSSSSKKAVRVAPKRKDGGENSGGDGRKCLHCATEKTPQWRTGPMGPKTLCNACGVRYKSGRLVPEYRPAASPTFMLTKHSNSHRKVLELRRQKELQRAQQQQQQLLHQSMMFDVSNGDDYLIHQHIGPDFRQLI
ncbi:GATA transcription factor 12-like [Diospyros lotus]|uniref:GATA transcription factor 12-like n=1 Tax=Diospyros lotus TaxID=55363 RepID=UPI002259BEB1|nr:GATA transcription factor 12-like [Diospyros lotus]